MRSLAPTYQRVAKRAGGTLLLAVLCVVFADGAAVAQSVAAPNGDPFAGKPVVSFLVTAPMVWSRQRARRRNSSRRTVCGRRPEAQPAEHLRAGQRVRRPGEWRRYRRRGAASLPGAPGNPPPRASLRRRQPARLRNSAGRSDSNRGRPRDPRDARRAGAARAGGDPRSRLSGGNRGARAGSR